MKFRRTREITIQTTETLSVRLEQVSSEVTCTRCTSGAPMLTPEAVAAAFGLSLRAIYRQVEAGGVHFQEIGAGRLLVCPTSLRNLVEPGSGELRPNLKHEENL